MTDVVERPEVGGSALSARVGGGLVVLLGTANLALAGVAAATDLIRLPVESAAVLGLLGLATALLGVLVLRGHRWALVASLVIFGGLFVLQAFASSGGTTTPALITLAVVVVPLVVALRSGGRTAGPDDEGTRPARTSSEDGQS